MQLIISAWLVEEERSTQSRSCYMLGRLKTRSVTKYKKYIRKVSTSPETNSYVFIQSFGFWEELQLEWRSFLMEKTILYVSLVYLPGIY